VLRAAQKLNNSFKRDVPYLVFEAPDLIRDIIDGFTDEEVKAIKHGLGSVNQFVDSTNQVSNNSLCEMLKAIYR
jgi:hypothetical protein